MTNNLLDVLEAIYMQLSSLGETKPTYPTLEQLKAATADPVAHIEDIWQWEPMLFNYSGSYPTNTGA
jgi:hypothetical protein